MNDMRAVIIPRSDQINADNLLSGPITITVKKVTIRPGTEQPVDIEYEGGKPYSPCKSMARVLVQCWGPDAALYPGRSMTLYCDPKVTWAGMAVGGIRISHLSHIDKPITMALTATKGSKKLFTVHPLEIANQSSEPTKKRTVADWLAELEAHLNSMTTMNELRARENASDVQTILRKPGANSDRVAALFLATKARFSEYEPGAEG
jgi:hypothetical protein